MACGVKPGAENTGALPWVAGAGGAPLAGVGAGEGTDGAAVVAA